MRKENSTNSFNEAEILHDCPITSTFNAIGGRWKVIILWQLRNHAMRYGELNRAIPNISQKMLTQQLKALTESGWVERKDYQQIPPKTEYKLSPLGTSFIPILQQIHDWGISNNILNRK
jgi:DNA-binding HxlR family transcriptional regulator